MMSALVGRDDALAELRGALAQAEDRHGRLVLVLAHPNSAGQKVGADARNIEPAGGATTMNSLSGMGLSLDTVHPFTKENPNGEVRLWCRKDRSGYGEGDELGTLRGRVEFGDDTSAVSMAMQLTAPELMVALVWLVIRPTEPLTPSETAPPLPS